MSILKVIIITIFILLNCSNFFSQNSQVIDSLINESSTVNSDTTRINIYLKIGELYENINTDSALYFYNNSVDIAQKNINTTQGSLQNKYSLLKADALRYIGIVYDLKGDYNTSLIYYEKSLNIYETLIKLKNNPSNRLYKKAAAYCYGNVALVLSNQSDFLKSIEYFRKSLNICKDIDDKMGEAYCYSNLGLVELNRRNFKESINFLQKSIEIKKRLKDKYGIMESYNILGVVYKYIGNYPLAIYYYQQSLKIAKEINNNKDIASCYNNIGIIHTLQGNYYLSIDYLQKATVIFDKLENKKGLASCYVNIGIAYEKLKKEFLCIEFTNKALKISEEINDKNTTISCLNNIAAAYEKKGLYSKAIEFFTKSLNISEEIHDRVGISYNNIRIANIYKTLADSSFNEDERKHYYDKAISLASNALDVSKKIESITLINDASLCLMLSNISKVNNFEAKKYAALYISSSDSIYNARRLESLNEMEARYQAENKQLQINNLKNEKKLQSETIARKEAENKKQKILIFTFITGLIVILLFSIILYRQFSAKKRANKLLSEQKKKITDSIKYAKQIQHAILPHDSFLDSSFKEYFVLYKPKDIVSGDFYWGTQINELYIITVADCTGHGVPGAFMSMLGVSLLNEIVRKKEITSTNLILDELRESIIESLHQKGSDDEQKDGLDIVMCVINSTTNELQYSGAYNPLYIINAEKQLTELIADKQPVGIHDNMIPFNNQLITLSNGDIIYLASDGYVDQIGGTSNKKFLSKNLKQLLISNCHLTMEQQKELLEYTIIEWIGEREQLDDITILGIKI